MTATGDDRTLREQIAQNQRLIDELNAQLGRKTAEVRIIQQISAEINATLALDEILKIILHSMDTVLGFRHCMVLLADEAGKTLRLAASRGYGEARLGASVPVGQGVIGVVARRRRMMRIGNLRAQMGYLASVRHHATADGASGVGERASLPGLADAESQIAIPLVVKDRLVGVFAVESATAGAFDELDELLLSIVANQVANAIDNAQLHQSVIERSEALDRANAELSALNTTLENKVAERTRELKDALNTVQDEQERSAALLRRMAPPSVIPLMLADKLAPRRIEVTILFTDLENFTGHTAGMEPDEVFSLLNHYFSWAGDVVQRYRGYVNKINGDGMMAIFGVPFESRTHRSDAAMAALALQRELQGQFPLRMRIGINSGVVTAGMLGPTNKSLYDVLGEAVNIASRMESVCPVEGIALPAAVAEPLKPWFDLASLGEHDIRGVGRIECVAVSRLRPLAADTRRIHSSSRFAAAHLATIEEIERIAAEQLDMIDFASIQSRDAAFRHNEAVAAFALALLRTLGETGDVAAQGIGETDLVLAALLHDVGKHAIDPDCLNRPALAADERTALRNALRDGTVAVLSQLDLARLEPVIRAFYAFEESRGETGQYEPTVEILGAADIYDALTAPKLYKGAPWSIVGALEELQRMPWCARADRLVFSTFSELMKPADAKLSSRARSRVVLR
jgi:adenylate cyclase